MTAEQKVSAENRIREWRTGDSDICDDLHWHFTEGGLRDWCDIGKEGFRLWNVMFPEHQIEEHSPIDGLLHAVAAQGQHGAYAAVASALGVSELTIRCVFERWEDKSQKPVTPTELIELIQNEEKELQEEGLLDV
jgi:hypothetical protein